MDTKHSNQDDPRYWRKIGWGVFLGSVIMILFAGAQAGSNPAAPMVYWIMAPFALIGAVLATSRRVCVWIAGSESDASVK